MANFFRDNEDIQFLFKHLDLATVAEYIEEGFRFAGTVDYAPATAEEAIRNYELVLDSLGQLSGDFIAPRSEGIDREGNTLNADGTVSYAKGVAESLRALAKADVMGFTLPHRFGGLNFPNLIYSIAIEIVSRADASLMNIFGLQGIAETINAFASEEIKQKYLHDFAAGKVTGAMVLTEPDAGSDLQAVKLRAYQDADGKWRLHGVKRFITNGCGEVLLVLARSEPDRSGGLGLSLFVCDRGPTVTVRRLEDKLGIHGSPTCELFFDHTPCELIGERQRGLVTYVMSLMNGARIGIAGQSMGIAEAAYRVAQDYAASREQFGGPIEKLPAVRDMLIDMKIAIEAGRALLYETSRIVDIEIGLTKIAENPEADKDKAKEAKNLLRKIKRQAAMLTPMSKYVCSEMCNRVTYDAIQVLGGSGYMRDYACERLARDARITTIYEGTSQLQVVAAVRGVCGGAFEKYIAELAEAEYADTVKDLTEILAAGTEQLMKAVAYVKEQGIDYMDLYGRAIVDIATDLIIGYLFCGQASSSVQMDVAVARARGNGEVQTVPMTRRKAVVARRFVTSNAPKIASLAARICSGDKTSFSEYDALVGPRAGAGIERMCMLQAVIFDFDGVVADSELLHYKAMHEALKRRGVDIPKEVHWEKYLGFTDCENAEVVNADYGMGWDAAELAAIVAEKTAIFDQLAKEETAIIEGVVEFVRRLREAGIPMAVCSGATRKDIDLMLAGTELAGAFSPIVTADDVRHGKPDPEGYLLALRRLNEGRTDGLSAGGCVAVEDSHWGLQAAAAAGMRRVAVTNTYSAGHLRPHADIVVDRLDRLDIAQLERLCG